VNWYVGNDHIVEPASAENANLVGVLFAMLFAFVALVSFLLAFVFRRRRVWLGVFILVALSACAVPPVVFYSVGDARPRGAAIPQSFGQVLFEHGVNSLEYLERDTGATLERQIQIYVYDRTRRERMDRRTRVSSVRRRAD
jgi:hypothetical protein